MALNTKFVINRNYQRIKGSQENMSEKIRILDMSVVSSKFQITLKKSVREAFNIRPGQRVMFSMEISEKGNKLILEFEG